MIPAFNISNVLPPFVGSAPFTPASSSPYDTSMTEVVLHFCTSTERKEILLGLLNYRKALADAGILTGFQWMNGSFAENIESTESRAPNDVDIVSFFKRPVNGTDQWRKWCKDNAELFNPQLTKSNFKVDAYVVDLDTDAASVVDQTCYWFGLFSHRRHSSLWKGMLKISFDSADDTKAQQALVSTET